MNLRQMAIQAHQHRLAREEEHRRDEARRTYDALVRLIRRHFGVSISDIRQVDRQEIEVDDIRFALGKGLIASIPCATEECEEWISRVIPTRDSQEAIEALGAFLADTDHTCFTCHDRGTAV